jgi:hypothetical protein
MIPTSPAAAPASRAKARMATTAQQHSKRYVTILVFRKSRFLQNFATSHCRKATFIEMQWLGRARGELASAMR